MNLEKKDSKSEARRKEWASMTENERKQRGEAISKSRLLKGKTPLAFIKKMCKENVLTAGDLSLINVVRCRARGLSIARITEKLKLHVGYVHFLWAEAVKACEKYEFVEDYIAAGRPFKRGNKVVFDPANPAGKRKYFFRNPEAHSRNMSVAAKAFWAKKRQESAELKALKEKLLEKGNSNGETND